MADEATASAENDQDQMAQAALIRETGNGPTVENETELLRAEFGEPSADGVYGAVGEEDN